MSDSTKDTKKETKYINAKRRGFLQGSAVAGGAIATGAVNASTTEIVESVEPAKPTGHAGYRVTDKVRRYYQRARF